MLVVVSLAIPPSPEPKLSSLTLATNDQVSKKPDSYPVWRRKDVMLSALLALVVDVVWIYFSG